MMERTPSKGSPTKGCIVALGLMVACAVSYTGVSSGERQDERASRAQQVHQQAWADVVDEAMGNSYYRFALYTSRVLAVCHPEIYLQGDRLFLDHITHASGYLAAYLEVNPHSLQYSEPERWFEGPPFAFAHVDLNELTSTLCVDLYPDEAPFFGFLDIRMAPVAVTLGSRARTVTELEKAVLMYFSAASERRQLGYIIYCGNGSAFLATAKEILAASDMKSVARIVGNPILIFNESYVWFPLMERDDSEKDELLHCLVQKHTSDAALPHLSAFEHRIVGSMRQVTQLNSAEERELALLAGSRGTSFHENELGVLWESHCPGVQHGVSLTEMHISNYLSPLAAYLSARIDCEALEETVTSMVRNWSQDFGFEHGHIWRCGLVQYNIDDALRLRYFHCEHHAENIAAVLDLAGIENYVIKAAPRADSRLLHTTTAIPDLGMVISDGKVDRGSIGLLYRGPRGKLEMLCEIHQGTKWACPFPDGYFGNWPPQELESTLASLKERIPSFSVYSYSKSQPMAPGVFRQFLRELHDDWFRVDDLLTLDCICFAD